MKININSRKAVKDEEQQLRMAEDCRKAPKSFFRVSYQISHFCHGTFKYICKSLGQRKERKRSSHVQEKFTHVNGMSIIGFKAVKADTV